MYLRFFVFWAVPYDPRVRMNERKRRKGEGGVSEWVRAWMRRMGTDQHVTLMLHLNAFLPPPFFFFGLLHSLQGRGRLHWPAFLAASLQLGPCRTLATSGTAWYARLHLLSDPRGATSPVASRASTDLLNACMCVRMCVCVHVCVHVCACVCACVCVSLSLSHTLSVPRCDARGLLDARCCLL